MAVNTDYGFVYSEVMEDRSLPRTYSSMNYMKLVA